MSSIAGETIFNSGPHRFVIKPVGKLFVPPLALDTLQTETEVLGTLELAIIQTGRLLGDNPGQLWGLVDAIKTHAEAQLNGTLVDNNGVSWTGMTLLRFKPEDRLDHGRVVSLRYRADYIRLAP